VREKFIERDFTADSVQLIERAVGICRDYTAQGFDLSVRQLYYQFVSRNWLANTERNYKRLVSVISDARAAGLIDWSWIRDRGRSTVSNSHWREPAEILAGAAAQYRRDVRESQPWRVEVMVEKQALEGVLEPVCSELDVCFTANKGYSSSSALYEAAKRLEAWARDVVVLYLGDHDPSGLDMSRDVEERELDALEPRVLAELVRSKVQSYTDDEVLEAEVARQTEEREFLKKLVMKARAR
jgi:hypothetical protein